MQREELLRAVEIMGTCIDTGLDVTRIPNFPVSPTPPAISGIRPGTPILRTTDFFTQGINFSLMWTW